MPRSILLSVAVVALIAIAGFYLGYHAAPVPVAKNSQVSENGMPVLSDGDASESELGRTSDDGMDKDMGQEIQRLEQEAKLPSLPEGALLSGTALNQTNIVQLQIAGNFDRILDGLRDSSNLSGSSKRMEIESSLYTTSEILNGEITIRALECGQRICAGELAGIDMESLDAFVANLLANEQIEMGSVIVLPTTQMDQNDASINIVFSHDPEVKGIASSR